MTIIAAVSVGMPAVTGHWPDLGGLTSKRRYVVRPTEPRRASICHTPARCLHDVKHTEQATRAHSGQGKWPIIDPQYRIGKRPYGQHGHDREEPPACELATLSKRSASETPGPLAGHGVTAGVTLSRPVAMQRWPSAGCTCG